MAWGLILSENHWFQNKYLIPEKLFWFWNHQTISFPKVLGLIPDNCFWSRRQNNYKNNFFSNGLEVDDEREIYFGHTCSVALSGAAGTIPKQILGCFAARQAPQVLVLGKESGPITAFGNYQVVVIVIAGGFGTFSGVPPAGGVIVDSIVARGFRWGEFSHCEITS